MEDSVIIFVGFTAWCLVFGGIGYIIGNTKGRGAAGFALGVLLGIIGWVIAALLGEAGGKCPECLGVVPEGARRCKHCGVELGTPVPQYHKSTQRGIYVLNGEKAEGPFAPSQLRALIQSGKLTGKTLGACEGDNDWQPIGKWL